jgi:hypothetical protein
MTVCRRPVRAAWQEGPARWDVGVQASRYHRRHSEVGEDEAIGWAIEGSSQNPPKILRQDPLPYLWNRASGAAPALRGRLRRVAPPRGTRRKHDVEQDMGLRCCGRPGCAGFIVAGCCPRRRRTRWHRTWCRRRWCGRRRGDIRAISANSAATPGRRTARNQAADREGQAAAATHQASRRPQHPRQALSKETSRLSGLRCHALPFYWTGRDTGRVASPAGHLWRNPRCVSPCSSCCC